MTERKEGPPPPPTSARRELTFATLDRVMPDVDRLLAGYEAVGRWTLGQVCNHLAKVVIGSVDGFPGRGPWLLRRTIGPAALRWVLRRGRMPDGVKAPGSLLPKSDLDDRAEAEALRAALRLFAAHAGPLPAHPFFGPLTREQAERLHRIHCAHHLSFLLPADGPG